MTAPAWIDPVLALSHVGENGDALAPYLAAAAAYVTARRPDLNLAEAADPLMVPDDVQLGTVILAARLYARRGTMLGLAQLGDGLVGSILRADPDVARLLRIGVHTAPGVS